MDSSSIGRAIRFLVESNKQVGSIGQFLDELKEELGGPGRRHLQTLTWNQLDGLFEQFKELEQGNARFSPVESHGGSEWSPSSSRSQGEALLAAGGRPLVAIPDRSLPQQQAIFDIELMPPNSQAPGSEIVVSARRDRQCAHSVIDRQMAAAFCGLPEATMEVINQVELRWRTYTNGQGTGPLKRTLCRIEHAEGADVVFGGEDLSEEEEEEEDKSDRKGKRRQEASEQDHVMDMVARMNAASALKLHEESRKRSSAARGHDDPQRKRTRH